MISSFAPAANSSASPKRVTPGPNTSAPCETSVFGCDESLRTVSAPRPVFVNVAPDAPAAAVNAWSMETSKPDESNAKPFAPIVADAHPQMNAPDGAELPLTFSVPPSAATPFEERETTLLPPTGTLFVITPPGNVTTASSFTLNSRSASNP